MSAASGRMPPLDEQRLSPDQKRVWDAIVSGPRGQVAGPLRVWLQSPDLADRAQALGQFARYDSSLPPHLSELAILVTARIWSSDFEWSHHAPLAAAAGVPDSVIEAVAHARRPETDDPEMSVVSDFAIELHRDRQVSDAVFDRATACLGTRSVVDLTGICGYYTLISMTINAFRIPPDHPPVLPQLDRPVADMFR